MRLSIVNFLKFVLCVILFSPINTFAHLISITPVAPFAASVPVSSTATASYNVNNISTIPITVIDQSQFPSGLSISSTTCGRLMPPRTSCVINLQLNAPATPTTLKGILREWAKPSADGVQLPITIQIVQASSQFTVTPSAGTGGTINPNTPQSVSSGDSLTFTATPNSGFAISQWTVDGATAQTGGTSFTLSNITTNHTVAVSFIAQFTVTPSAGTGGTISPSTPQTVSSGDSLTFTATPNSGFSVAEWLVDGTNAQTGGTSFTLNNITANHTVAVTFSAPIMSIAAGQNQDPSPVQPFIAYNNNAMDTTNWASTTQDFVPLTAATSAFVAGSCTGSGSTAACVAAGTYLATVPFFRQETALAYTTNGGATWTAPTLFTPGRLLSASVSTTGSTLVLAAAGNDSVDGVVVASINGGIWETTPINSLDLQAISCVGTQCTVVGSNTISDAGEIYTNPDISAAFGNFTLQPVTGLVGDEQLNDISCSGSLCIVVGTTTPATAIPLAISNTPTWHTVPLPVIDGSLFKVSCSGQICAATGSDSLGSAILILSNDGGNTWTNFSSVALGAQLTSVSCSGNTCVAGGNIGPLPFLTMTTNASASPTWTTILLPARANGIFNGVSCAGTGVSTLCTAAGSFDNGGTTAPLLAANSNNSTSNWQYITSISNLPTSGVFNAAASSNTLAGKKHLREKSQKK